MPSFKDIQARQDTHDTVVLSASEPALVPFKVFQVYAEGTGIAMKEYYLWRLRQRQNSTTQSNTPIALQWPIAPRWQHKFGKVWA